MINTLIALVAALASIVAWFALSPRQEEADRDL